MAGRVLIVDDEPYILKILSFKLRREGLTTYEAVSAEEAREVLRQHPVDLILLDVALATPTNGFEFARQLRRNPEWADLPIIMLTARHLADDVRMGREVGAVGYITKPLSTAEVLERIRAILEGPEERSG